MSAGLPLLAFSEIRGGGGGCAYLGSVHLMVGIW